MEGKPEVIRTRQSAWIKTLVDACKSGRNVLVIDDAEFGIKREDLPESVSLYLSKQDIIASRQSPRVAALAGVLLVLVGIAFGCTLAHMLTIAKDVSLVVQILFSFTAVSFVAMGTLLYLDKVTDFEETQHPRDWLAGCSISTWYSALIVLAFLLCVSMFLLDSGIFETKNINDGMWKMVIVMFIAVILSYGNLLMRRYSKWRNDRDVKRFEGLADQLRQSENGVIPEPKK
jgi:hypothetical protein